jgi:hypothetical protein
VEVTVSDSITIVRFLENFINMFCWSMKLKKTANTYNLNASNEVLIKLTKSKLEQLCLALKKYLLIFIIVNRVIIFLRCYEKYFNNKL